MYNSFFGFTRNPFDLSPDPVCFVSTAAHNEALATLYYGVRQHKGFIVVTGEVGTGKTLLLRCLLQLLQESSDIEYSYVFNSRLGASDFLRYMISDFGITVSNESKADQLLTFTDFLTSRGRRHLTTVLIIDEAHDLSEDVLEEIRLLSNIETANDKLLQILLIGQPELEEKLDTVGLRQLKQRIALRAQLRTLTSDETTLYVLQRLEIAGVSHAHSPIFEDDALTAIYRHSNGVPRLINTLCENALMSAYATQTSPITAKTIDEVAAEFRLGCNAFRDFDTLNGNRVDTLPAPLATVTTIRNPASSDK